MKKTSDKGENSSRSTLSSTVLVAQESYIANGDSHQFVNRDKGNEASGQEAEGDKVTKRGAIVAEGNGESALDRIVELSPQVPDMKKRPSGFNLSNLKQRPLF